MHVRVPLWAICSLLVICAPGASGVAGADEPAPTSPVVTRSQCVSFGVWIEGAGPVQHCRCPEDRSPITNQGDGRHCQEISSVRALRAVEAGRRAVEGGGLCLTCLAVGGALQIGPAAMRCPSGLFTPDFETSGIAQHCPLEGGQKPLPAARLEEFLRNHRTTRVSAAPIASCPGDMSPAERSRAVAEYYLLSTRLRLGTVEALQKIAAIDSLLGEDLLNGVGICDGPALLEPEIAQVCRFYKGPQGCAPAEGAEKLAAETVEALDRIQAAREKLAADNVSKMRDATAEPLQALLRQQEDVVKKLYPWIESSTFKDLYKPEEGVSQEHKISLATEALRAQLKEDRAALFEPVQISLRHPIRSARAVQARRIEGGIQATGILPTYRFAQACLNRVSGVEAEDCEKALSKAMQYAPPWSGLPDAPGMLPSRRQAVNAHLSQAGCYLNERHAAEVRGAQMARGALFLATGVLPFGLAAAGVSSGTLGVQALLAGASFVSAEQSVQGAFDQCVARADHYRRGSGGELDPTRLSCPKEGGNPGGSAIQNARACYVSATMATLSALGAGLGTRKLMSTLSGETVEAPQLAKALSNGRRQPDAGVEEVTPGEYEGAERRTGERRVSERRVSDRRNRNFDRRRTRPVSDQDPQELVFNSGGSSASLTKRFVPRETKIAGKLAGPDEFRDLPMGSYLYIRTERGIYYATRDAHPEGLALEQLDDPGVPLINTHEALKNGAEALEGRPVRLLGAGTFEVGVPDRRTGRLMDIASEVAGRSGRMHPKTANLAADIPELEKHGLAIRNGVTGFRDYSDALVRLSRDDHVAEQEYVYYAQKYRGTPQMAQAQELMDDLARRFPSDVPGHYDSEKLCRIYKYYFENVIQKRLANGALPHPLATRPLGASGLARPASQVLPAAMDELDDFQGAKEYLEFMDERGPGWAASHLIQGRKPISSIRTPIDRALEFYRRNPVPESALPHVSTTLLRNLRTAESASAAAEFKNVAGIVENAEREAESARAALRAAAGTPKAVQAAVEAEKAEQRAHAVQLAFKQAEQARRAIDRAPTVEETRARVEDFRRELQGIRNAATGRYRD